MNTYYIDVKILNLEGFKTIRSKKFPKINEEQALFLLDYWKDDLIKTLKKQGLKNGKDIDVYFDLYRKEKNKENLYLAFNEPIDRLKEDR